jgi:hypothetical protein
VSLGELVGRYLLGVMTPCSVGVMTPEATSTAVRLGVVPNQPRTPMRSFRISKELYEAAKAKAAERGESLSDVVRRALERYVRSKP